MQQAQDLTATMHESQRLLKQDNLCYKAATLRINKKIQYKIKQMRYPAMAYQLTYNIYFKSNEILTIPQCNINGHATHDIKPMKYQTQCNMWYKTNAIPTDIQHMISNHRTSWDLFEQQMAGCTIIYIRLIKIQYFIKKEAVSKSIPVTFVTGGGGQGTMLHAIIV